MRVAVTGVCASGKTTLVHNLRQHNLEAYNVAQEHSLVKTLWKKKNPDLLVTLDATLPVIKIRRIVPWGEERLIAQHERLINAREHADIFIQTDNLSKDEVTDKVLDYIRRLEDDHG
jgi:deoxyadenosine/deoxycytidine kinase